MILGLIHATTQMPTFSAVGGLLADRWYLDFICRRDVLQRFPELHGILGLTGSGVTLYIISSGIYSVPTLIPRVSTALGTENVDYVGDGTGMAFIAASNHYGVAPRCNIVSLNVYDSNGTINPTKYQQAVNFILSQSSNKTKLVLTSAIRSPRLDYLLVQTDLDRDTKRLIQAGCIIVAGAGDGLIRTTTHECVGPILAEVCHPLHFEEIFVASAIDCKGVFPLFANYGSAVTTFAPGVDIITANKSGNFIIDSSTRYSGAILAGILCLFLEKFPYASYEDVKTFIHEHFFRTGNAVPYPLERLQKDPFECEDYGYLTLRSDTGWPYPYLVDTKIEFKLAHGFFTISEEVDNMISLGSVLANTEFQIPLDIKFKNKYGEVKPGIYKIISVQPSNIGQFEVGERSGILFGVVHDVQTSVVCTIQVSLDDGLNQYRRNLDLHVQPNYIDLYTVGGVLKARLSNVSGLNIDERAHDSLLIDQQPPQLTEIQVPITRNVNLLKKSTGSFMGQTVTPLSTGEFLFVVASGMYQAIVLDQLDEYTGYVIDNLRATP